MDIMSEPDAALLAARVSIETSRIATPTYRDDIGNGWTWVVQVFRDDEDEHPAVTIVQTDRTGAMLTETGDTIPNLDELAAILDAPADEKQQLLAHLRKEHPDLFGDGGPHVRIGFSPLPREQLSRYPLAAFRAIHAAWVSGTRAAGADAPPCGWVEAPASTAESAQV
jgi:hypothetical protein